MANKKKEVFRPGPMTEGKRNMWAMIRQSEYVSDETGAAEIK